MCLLPQYAIWNKIECNNRFDIKKVFKPRQLTGKGYLYNRHLQSCKGQQTYSPDNEKDDDRHEQVIGLIVQEIVDHAVAPFLQVLQVR